MLLLNFSHPLTSTQLAAVQALTKQPDITLHNIRAQFNHQQPFAPQLAQMLAPLPLTPEQWQTASILVNPPSLNYITGVLLAELHGRMGYFPPLLRLRPIQHSTPPAFEVAEILDLQNLRNTARTTR